MTCTDFESALADYLDGSLSSRERTSLEAHLEVCPECRELHSEAAAGRNYLAHAAAVEPPPELITRIAYLAPRGRTLLPSEKPGISRRFFDKVLQPILQPRLAMGMAMTILSFAMLRRCTGVDVHEVKPADLSPVRVLGGVEDKALRLRDQVVKYYDNLRIVYEIESHLHDLNNTQNPDTAAPRRPRATSATPSVSPDLKRRGATAPKAH